MSVVALCGGVGGAKLALGLYRVLGPDHLAVIVNTGDDFDHLGLRICPDLDTVVYTLAGLVDPTRGWGRGDETWSMMDTLDQFGEETWFRLGDRDLALHLIRTQRLRRGESLSSCMRELARLLGVRAAVIPMSDEPIATRVLTEEGTLDFQVYFVARRCAPRVCGVRFDGAERARASAGVLEALGAPDLQALVICPSNPYLSVDPILAVSDIRRALLRRHVPCIAVSPLVGGQAVKGPTAKIMNELNVPATPASIAQHFRGLIDALVIDQSDADLPEDLPVPVFTTRTRMHSLADREELARFVLECSTELASGRACA